MDTEPSSETVHQGHDHTLFSWMSVPSNQEKGASTSILVIEDNRVLRNAIKDGLLRQGFEVWIAADGMEGLSLYRLLAKGIDVVLTDVNMPRLDGVATVQAIREFNSAACCCFMSCDIRPTTVEALLSTGAVRVFKKPLPSLAALADMLRDVVGANSQASEAPRAVSGAERHGVAAALPVDGESRVVCELLPNVSDVDESGHLVADTLAPLQLDVPRRPPSRTSPLTPSAKLSLCAGFAFAALGVGALIAKLTWPADNGLDGMLPVGGFYLLLALSDTVVMPRLQKNRTASWDDRNNTQPNTSDTAATTTSPNDETVLEAGHATNR